MKIWHRMKLNKRKERRRLDFSKQQSIKVVKKRKENIAHPHKFNII
jgi:hypothetical protein